MQKKKRENAGIGCEAKFGMLVLHALVRGVLGDRNTLSVVQKRITIEPEAKFSQTNERL